MARTAFRRLCKGAAIAVVLSAAPVLASVSLFHERFYAQPLWRRQ